jgi:hypothetical protein
MSEEDIENYRRDYPSAKRFHTKMVKYLDEYTEYNLLIKSDGEKFSHHPIIHEFLAYLFGQHLISDISEITVAMANSKFFAHYKIHNPEIITSSEIKTILNGYFTFIYGKYGVKNEKIMRGFKKAK